MEKQLKAFLKGMKLNEDTISTILGAVVLIVIGALIFNYFNASRSPQISDEGLNINPTPSAQEQTPDQVELVEENGELVPKGLPTTYKVEKGDHLWSIAEKFYQSGYNWVDIAQANSLASPDMIEVGQELAIPKAAAMEPTYVAQTPTSIDGNSYTVQAGDSLWDISVRAYGDGYAWTRIYEANKAVIGNNAGIIEVGTVLSLPR
jgi:nucleoid-associated protein YgaU